MLVFDQQSEGSNLANSKQYLVLKEDIWATHHKSYYFSLDEYTKVDYLHILMKETWNSSTPPFLDQTNQDFTPFYRNFLNPL